ncbi:MAG: hypothetical protein IPF52_14460 [Saprospiraceae bacterium]|nr:hypothetical protein [Saprospiraceae bacterium]
MNQRANDSLPRKVKGVVNIAKHFVVDKGLNKIMGEKWGDETIHGGESSQKN